MCVLVTDMDNDVLLLLLPRRSLKHFLSYLGLCSHLTGLAKDRKNHAHTQLQLPSMPCELREYPGYV